MANTNGDKYALTALFPIRGGEENHYEQLRLYLRGLDSDPLGSPLSRVGIVHMARFAIIDNLIYQGLPAKRDRLKSRYLLFMCDFDGASLDPLVGAMSSQMGDVVDAIWQHCVAYPGRTKRDLLIAYFERCQLTTTLFFCDQPKAELSRILRGLMAKREFAKFVEDNQRLPRTGLKQRFEAMWKDLCDRPTPKPGSM
jgi:hypothetical protein